MATAEIRSVCCQHASTTNRQPICPRRLTLRPSFRRPEPSASGWETGNATSIRSLQSGSQRKPLWLAAPIRMARSTSPVSRPASRTLRSASTHSTSTSGCASRQPIRVARRLPAETELLCPSTNPPARPWPAARIIVTSLSAVATIGFAPRIKVFPASVIVTPARERSKIGIPIARSSFRMARLSVDCSMSSARAAR